MAAMVAQAQEQGMALTSPDGLLKQLTKAVLKTALNAEMTEHLGHANLPISRAGMAPMCVMGPGRRRWCRTRSVRLRLWCRGIGKVVMSRSS